MAPLASYPLPQEDTVIDTRQKEKLVRFCHALIDQERARIIVPPLEPSTGFWFGGGNLVEGPDGTLYLSGRYRTYGDSRTGLHVGERGVELAIFKSRDRGQTFTKLLSWSKQELSPEGQPVLSIEGSALRLGEDEVELYVSSEKASVGYPSEVRSYQKPSTGVWTIDRVQADSIAGLKEAAVEPLLACTDPRYLHVKDPSLYQTTAGDTCLVFCTHPFNWTSSNSGYAVRHRQTATYDPPVYNWFRRGFTWDVAISRITCLLRVPQIGAFAGLPPIVLALYDGGECMRDLDEHAQAVVRPRGYSCEEIGGVAWGWEEDLSTLERLSVTGPMFLSPHGTGCSRYVDALQTKDGFYATWEQSQADLSQALVMNVVSREAAEAILAG
jgi:hypothetical protein